MAFGNNFWISLHLFLSFAFVRGGDANSEFFCSESGCFDPFAPGHQNVGTAWWAIGSEKFQAPIDNLTTVLVVPRSYPNRNGAPVINCALENTVSAQLIRSAPKYDYKNRTRIILQDIPLKQKLSKIIESDTHIKIEHQ